MPEDLRATIVPVFDRKDVEEHKAIAALSYVWILFLVPLLAKKESRFCQEHAKQGLVVFLAWLVGGFVFWVPFFGWIAAIALFGANLVALFTTLQGSFWEIPLIGPLRKKFNL